jgi:dTMP kinase
MGFLLVLEGPDGAGKSTQSNLLVHALEDRGYSVLAAREPGGTPLGDAIRRLMLDTDYEDVPQPTQALTWAFMMNACRAELVQSVLRPSLSGDRIIVLDRFWYSTLAYQGAGDGLDEVELLSMCRLAVDDVRPDLVVLLDLPPAEGLLRKSGRETNVIDRRPVEYHNRVMRAYHAMAAREPRLWRVVNAAGTADDVHRSILGHVLPRLLGANIAHPQANR